MTPRGRADKPRQAVQKPQTEGKQSHKLTFPQQGDHNARQDSLNTTIKPVGDQQLSNPFTLMGYKLSTA